MSMYEEQGEATAPVPTGHKRADEWAAEEHAAAVAEGRGCWHCGAIAEGIAAQKRGHQLAYGTPYPTDYVWLGDLAGMEVVPVLREGPAGPALQLRVTHRCGNEGVLMANMGMDGMSDDGAIMLGSLVEFAVKLREGHACPPHQPSPEHQARMQRWTDSASGGARPVIDRDGGPQAGLLASGPMTPVTLETDGQRLFREGRYAEAEIPLAREILGDEAAEQLAARRPGCPTCYTPVDDDGVQREHHIQCSSNHQGMSR